MGVCRFHKIGINWYDAFDGFFWKFAHKNSDCNSRDIDVEWAKKYGQDFKSDLVYLAYPRSEKMDNDVRQHYGMFREEHQKNLKKIDSLFSAEAN